MENFKEIKKYCELKMRIDSNIECEHRRKYIAGLDGCICNKENCIKIKQLAESSGH